MPVDPNESVIDKHKEAVEATKSQSRMAAYAEKLTRGSRGQVRFDLSYFQGYILALLVFLVPM